MKYVKLTDRLLKIASLVDNGKRIADIGTDHGYIPVYLLNQNKIQYAILGDVNKGPLENARKEVTHTYYREYNCCGLVLLRQKNQKK